MQKHTRLAIIIILIIVTAVISVSILLSSSDARKAAGYHQSQSRSSALNAEIHSFLEYLNTEDSLLIEKTEIDTGTDETKAFIFHPPRPPGAIALWDIMFFINKDRDADDNIDLMQAVYAGGDDKKEVLFVARVLGEGAIGKNLVSLSSPVIIYGLGSEGSDTGINYTLTSVPNQNEYRPLSFHIPDEAYSNTKEAVMATDDFALAEIKELKNIISTKDYYLKTVKN